MNHNSLGRGYETFGNATAETVERTLRPNEERYVGKPVTERAWYRPWPPHKKFLWSLRNNTNYMQTGCLAILDYTAKHAQEMLRNFYRKGYNSWQKGLQEKPFAYVIPENQGDRRRVGQMIELLRSHRIEVARAAREIKVKEGEFPQGTFVVRLDQPYRNYAVDLLEPQKFPANAPYEPYDDVSWALSVHYGVEVKRIDDESIKEVPLEPLPEMYKPVGRVRGVGPAFLLKDTGQEALLAARFHLVQFKVEIAERSFKVGDDEYPAGSWILPAQPGLQSVLEEVAEELALDFKSANSEPDVPRHEALVPRLAVWHTWADTEAVGWIRYTLDQQKIPYTYIRDEEIRAGNLRESFDVIIFGENYLDLRRQIHGIDPKFGPMPYTRTPEFSSHGVPDASEDITGGIGWSGMMNLQRFLDEGGVLITLGNGSALALEGGLVRNVRRGSRIFSPGVELKAKFLRPHHPIAYGYPLITSAFRRRYPVYQVRPADRRWIVLQWGTRPPKHEREEEKEQALESKEDTKMVVSGGMRDQDELEGHAAILDLPAGKGRVLTYNFNPMHRDLNHSDYRFFWNAILNWNSLPPAIP